VRIDAKEIIHLFRVLRPGQIRGEPVRAATWERAESEADFWIATHYPEMYGQVSFEREA
jgi:hypothetical protein